MPTGYDANPKTNYNVPPLRSGYNFTKTDTDTLTIPAVGVEDVDRGLFDLFDKEMPLVIKASDGIRKVPIIFSAGEKWAIFKKGIPRDKAGSIILPIIVIGRTGVSQNISDITNRGMSPYTGEIVIKRRLHKSNRDYQSLINRLLLKNQTNVALNSSQDPDTLVTSRAIGDLSNDPTVRDGGLMMSDNANSIYETIVMPSPQFFTATYEVTMWTQYIQQMNQLLENIISSQLPQGNSWQIQTTKGYWFLASVSDNAFNSDNNFQDFSREERVIKYTFQIKVQGYIFATNTPGSPVPIRRYVSNPDIQFAVDTGDDGDIDDPYLGADDPTLSLSNEPIKRRDQRDTGSTLINPRSGIVNPNDPALTTYPRSRTIAKYDKIEGIDGNGNRVIKYVKVKHRNKHTGETIYTRDFDLGSIGFNVK